MKKIALLLALGLNVAVSAFAVEVPVGPGPYAPSTKAKAEAPGSDVYFHFGPLNLTLPWEQVNVVYLYDLNAKRNLVGGEAVVATIWKLEATAGAVTSLDGRGAPYVGGNLWLPNPVQAISFLNEIHPGFFGGFDFTKSAAIYGFKAAVSIF